MGTQFRLTGVPPTIAFVCMFRDRFSIHFLFKILIPWCMVVWAWRDSMMNYIGASTEWSRSTATAGWVFDSYMDTVRTYTMMRGDSLYHITLPMYKDFGSAVMKAYRKAKREHRMDPVIRVVDGIPRQIYGDEYS